jgi:hypothetical protein
MPLQNLTSALLLSLLTAPFALAQYPGLPHDLDLARQAYDHAQMTGDRAALERLVAPDYLILSGSGKVRDRAWLIESFCAPDVHNHPFTVQAPFARALSPDSYLLGGWAELSGTDHGKPFSEKIRFADTWVRRNGHWLVAFTSVAASPAP